MSVIDLVEAQDEGLELIQEERGSILRYNVIPPEYLDKVIVLSDESWSYCGRRPLTNKKQNSPTNQIRTDNSVDSGDSFRLRATSSKAVVPLEATPDKRRSDKSSYRNKIMDEYRNCKIVQVTRFSQRTNKEMYSSSAPRAAKTPEKAQHFETAAGFWMAWSPNVRHTKRKLCWKRRV